MVDEFFIPASESIKNDLQLMAHLITKLAPVIDYMKLKKIERRKSIYFLENQ